jgi:hypothetical protein
MAARYKFKKAVPSWACHYKTASLSFAEHYSVLISVVQVLVAERLSDFAVDILS